MTTATSQAFGPHPLDVRDTDHYTHEYVEDFVDRWDQLIDWQRRARAEGSFFIDLLRERGCQRVLDVAAGTGFHSVRLAEAGFEVVSADGSDHMIAKAFRNGIDRGLVLKTVQADWRKLKQTVAGKYDAVICLGNSFTHLFDEADRRKALAEFYAALKHDGLLILDHRNYDAILDRRSFTPHRYYYCGRDVSVEPVHADPGLARFRYEFSNGETFHLNMFPLRQQYMRRLLQEAGFPTVQTYGDFQETDYDENPDFFAHVAEKHYE